MSAIEVLLGIAKKKSGTAGTKEKLHPRVLVLLAPLIFPGCSRRVYFESYIVRFKDIGLVDVVNTSGPVFSCFFFCFSKKTNERDRGGSVKGETSHYELDRSTHRYDENFSRLDDVSAIGWHRERVESLSNDRSFGWKRATFPALFSPRLEATRTTRETRLDPRCNKEQDLSVSLLRPLFVA